MLDLHSLATFFGWCTILNIGLIILVHIVIMSLRDLIDKMARSIFGVTSEETSVTLFRVVTQYRLAVAMFNFIPYVALKIMLA